MEALSSTEVNRRARERIPFEARVEIEIDGRKFEAPAQDIATGGICIAFAEQAPVRVGDRVVLRFRLPHLTAPTEARAVVRWVGGVGYAAVGLEFTEGLRAREVWAINQLAAATVQSVR